MPPQHQMLNGLDHHDDAATTPAASAAAAAAAGGKGGGRQSSSRELEALSMRQDLDWAHSEIDELRSRLQIAVSDNVRLAEENLELKRKMDKGDFARAAMDTLRTENDRLTKQVKSLRREVEKLQHNADDDENDDMDWSEMARLRRRLDDEGSEETSAYSGSERRRSVMTVVSNASIDASCFEHALDKANRTVYFVKAHHSSLPKSKASSYAKVLSITELEKRGHFKLFSTEELSDDALGSIFGRIYRVEYIKSRGGAAIKRGHGRVSSKKDMVRPEQVVSLMKLTKKSYKEKLEEMDSEREHLLDAVSRLKHEHGADREQWNQKLERLRAERHDLRDEVSDVKKKMAAKNRDTMKQLMHQMKEEMDSALRDKDREIEDILGRVKSNNKKFLSFSGLNGGSKLDLGTSGHHHHHSHTSSARQMSSSGRGVDANKLYSTLRQAEKLSSLPSEKDVSSRHHSSAHLGSSSRHHSSSDKHHHSSSERRHKSRGGHAA